MGELKKWREQNWVRIDSEGNIVGKCGTSPDKKNPDRCLPESKARSLTKAERAATARKKKKREKRVRRLCLTLKKPLLKACAKAVLSARKLRGAAVLF